MFTFISDCPNCDVFQINGIQLILQLKMIYNHCNTEHCITMP